MKCGQNQEFSKMWTCCHRWPRSKCCCCWKGERRWARLTENGGVLLQKVGKCKGELQLVWTISLLSYFIREVNSLGTFYLCPDQHVFRCCLWRRGEGGRSQWEWNEWAYWKSYCYVGGNKASILKELRTGWEWGVWGEGGESRNEEVRATADLTENLKMKIRRSRNCCNCFCTGWENQDVSYWSLRLWKVLFA